MSSDTADWSIKETGQWLSQSGFDNSIVDKFQDQEIDGETLLALTERMVERLFPNMKKQLLFLKLQQQLIAKKSNEVTTISDRIESAIPQPTCSSDDPGTPAPWPSFYTLPEFPPHVQMALDKKNPIFRMKGKSGLRAALIQVLFDDISKSSWYPTHKMYSDVLCTLCTKYPFLKDTSNSGHIAMLDSLKNKFKKERQPLVTLDAVKVAKDRFGSPGRGRKRKGNELEQVLVKKHRNCVVTADEGEDKHSIDQHLKAMLKEMAKPRPNMSSVRDLMGRAASGTCHIIENHDTKEILQQCPYLLYPSLLLHQMDLMCQVNLDVAIRHNISIYCAPILRKLESNKMAKLLSRTVDNEIEELKQQGYQRSASLLMLPLLFRENVELLFTVNKDPVAATPTLVLQRCPEDNPLMYQEASVMMDDMIVVRDDHDMDILNGLACVFAIYFVYGIEYPKGLKNTMNFLQKFIFKMDINEKLPTTVLRVQQSLL